MAQFKAEIQGTRGEASRLGSKNSGMRAHVHGWNVGVKILAEHKNGKDVFYVYRTGGSNNACIGTDPLAVVE